MLRCNTSPHHQVEPVSAAIMRVPANATRVEITCLSRRNIVRLNFSELTNVRELTLDAFNVTSESREMFRGLTRITSLTLRNLNWRRMERETFDRLSSLRTLSVERLDYLEYLQPELLQSLTALVTLSFRHISDRLMYADYAAILRHVTSDGLRTLTLHAVHSERHPETKLDTDVLFNGGLSSQALVHLDMGRNNIVNVVGDPVRCWPVLEYVSFAGNAFLGAAFLTVFWVRFFAHPRVKTMDLSWNNERALKSFDAVFSLIVDETCERGALPLSLGPRMTSLSVSHATYISNTHGRHYPMCIRNRNHSMRYLDMSNTRSTVPLAYSLVRLRSLRVLNLQNMNMQRLRGTLFTNMPRLSALLLGRNNIGASIANLSRQALFARNTNLRLLDLAGCGITDIPADEFSDLSRLRILNLSTNQMANFTAKLSKLTSLRFLNISDNRLSTLPPTMLGELDDMALRRTIHVDISTNPLLCESEFVTWAKTTKVHFLRAEKTLCADENGTRRIELNVASDRLVVHVDNYVRNVVIAVSLSAVALAIPVFVWLSYRFRWQVALCCHRMKGAPAPGATQRNRKYKRDAFICYNSNDRVWVCGDLLRHLEANAVTTILHHRDFLPGSVLEDTIRESIAMSRFIVLILSPDFLASNWCLLEMHLARSRATSEDRDVIVPIILREFPAAQVTRTLEAILSRSYLEWTDDRQGQTLFWDKLINKLKHGGNIRVLDNTGV